MRFEEIAEDVYICEAPPDVRAVMGAKTSRTTNLRKRFRQLTRHGTESEKTAQFLQENLAGYNHASIGEMAEVWVHYRNIGWPFAWLVEDTPLFIGQETSTRAVDLTNNDEMCHGAPEELQPIHDAWMELYKEAVANADGSDTYKLDSARYLLPSTARTGVTYCGNARVGVRQMEKIMGLGGAHGALALQMLAGMREYAPETVLAVHRGPRTPDYAWRPRTTVGMCSSKKTTRVTSHATWENVDPEWPARTGARQYLDPIWSKAGTFSVQLNCSVAAARDWHRHRPMLPWEIWPVAVSRTSFCLRPAEAAEHLEIHEDLWQETSNAFHRLYARGHGAGEDMWLAMYALPFCAEVQLHATGTLPELLYMLELRATASGANAEYQKHACELLVALEKCIPEQLRERLKITACLWEES